MVNVLNGLLVALVAAMLTYCIFELYDKYQNKKFWKNWKKKPFNFPYIVNGNEMWISRSVAVSLFCFARNPEGEWCVLANKRGQGTPDFQGYWNCISGYLDYNENSYEAARRECHEETGINVPLELIHIDSVVSDPLENLQNVSIRHYAIMDGIRTDQTEFSLKDAEYLEVAEVKWIPLSEIDNYNWAFHHLSIIKELARKYLVQ